MSITPPPQPRLPHDLPKPLQRYLIDEQRIIYQLWYKLERTVTDAAGKSALFSTIKNALAIKKHSKEIEDTKALLTMYRASLLSAIDQNRQLIDEARALSMINMSQQQQIKEIKQQLNDVRALHYVL